MAYQVGSVRRWIDHCDLSGNIIFLFTENKNIASPLWAVRLKELVFSFIMYSKTVGFNRYA
jgi:hypothetical protein